ncbi:MAG: pilin [Candidatus Gracilibacteria bacterium]|jgi:hypothetical protein
MAKLWMKRLGKIHMGGLLLALFLGIFVFSASHALADFLPLPSAENLDLPAPEGDTALEKFENLLGPVARNLRIIVGAVALLFIVVSGFTMVISGDNEETAKTQRKSLVYGLVGFLMISIAGPIAEVFDYREGNFLSDPEKLVERVELFDNTTRLIITFVKYLLGGLAALFFIRSGAVMVISGDNEEEVGNAKKSMALSAAGLLMVMVSDMVIRRVFYVAEFNQSADKTIVVLDQNEGVQQMVAVTNIVVSFVGPIMMLGIVAGGLLYITAGGDEERSGLAKKIIMNSVIGVIVIYGAFALVSTIIAGKF